MDKQIERIPFEQWGMRIAEVVSLRATCVRRAVGCVLFSQQNQILATGYNGPASGTPHCSTTHCTCQDKSAPSGTSLDACRAIHAEQNALLQCSDVSKVHSIFVTTSPCVTCTKLLMNTGGKKIFYKEMYSDIEQATKLWCTSATRKPLKLRRLISQVVEVEDGF